jgi:UDP-N-acetylmuramoyl-L-alanyl-D-glutamate--2,6-diaminopimelate ligase|tara:strand:+ start:18380 stop:19837 length:1458 start_codon:yes stop_codon:yes gene_type:complete
LAKLKNILYEIKLIAISGSRELEITGIAFDSRKVKPGDLFVAIKGLTTDGHAHLDQAVSLGAVALLVEQVPLNPPQHVAIIQTDDCAKSLGIIAGNFYNHPSRKLKLIGITGTNGKTTTVTLLHALFTQLGYQVGMLSTVENRIGQKIVATKYTTPDVVAINQLLAEMISEGCQYAFMEVSSHALVQERVNGLTFSGGVFTNISHDHLDYHLSFDEYIKAKKILFDLLGKEAFALVNADDKRGAIMLQNTKASKYRYSLKGISEFKAKILNNTFQGLELEINGHHVWFKLIGAFNAYNLLTAFSIANILGEDEHEVLIQLSQLTGARGRFEYILNDSKVMAIVDYAHTPDALDNVLSTIDGLRTRNEQLITVIGCGGNRDKEKRPKMASIAARYSDKVILTSDNPRFESPEAILDDMMLGISASVKKKVMRITDRKEAIRVACNLAKSADVILVAGKGHEDYQEIEGSRTHFDDKEVLTEMLNGR